MKRKLILFGKNSLILTLPFEFIKKNKLNKGDEVDLVEYEKRIMIETDKKTKKIAKIILDENKKLKIFNKELIGYYLKNYDFIHICGKEVSKKLQDINIIKKDLTSLEIVSLEENKIILKDLTNLDDLEVLNTIDEMRKIVELMFNNLIEQKKENLEMNIGIDSNLNKLYFLGVKALNHFIENNLLDKENNRFFENRRILESLERIGDLIKRISRFLIHNQKNQEITFKLFLDSKNYIDFILKLINLKSNIEKNLDLYLDKKNAMLKSIDQLLFETKDSYDYLLLITQFLKEIFGSLDDIVQSVIDSNSKEYNEN